MSNAYDNWSVDEFKVMFVIFQIMDKKGYVIRIYEGHDKSIKMLSLCSKKNTFLSVSGDSIKVWILPELDSNAADGN